MQKHKKRKTCKKSNKIKKNTFAPAISTSYLFFNLSFAEVGNCQFTMHIDLISAQNPIVPAKTDKYFSSLRRQPAEE